MKFHWFSLCSLIITNLSISITLYSSLPLAICGKCRSKHKERIKSNAEWLEEDPGTEDESQGFPGVSGYNTTKR